VVEVLHALATLLPVEEVEEVEGIRLRLSIICLVEEEEEVEGLPVKRMTLVTLPVRIHQLRLRRLAAVTLVMTTLQPKVERGTTLEGTGIYRAVVMAEEEAVEVPLMAHKLHRLVELETVGLRWEEEEVVDHIAQLNTQADISR